MNRLGKYTRARPFVFRVPQAAYNPQERFASGAGQIASRKKSSPSRFLTNARATVYKHKHVYLFGAQFHLQLLGNVRVQYGAIDTGPIRNEEKKEEYLFKGRATRFHLINQLVFEEKSTRASKCCARLSAECMDLYLALESLRIQKVKSPLM